MSGETQIGRVIAATREKVWAAWTEPARLVRWLGARGFVAKTLPVRMELRPGGVFHYGALLPGGKETWGRWTFRDVEPESRLAFVHSFSDARGGVARHPLNDRWPLELLTEARLEETDGGTRLTVTWTPVGGSDAERRAFAEGRAALRREWGAALDQLQEYAGTQ